MKFESITYMPTAAQLDGISGRTEVPRNREQSRNSHRDDVRDEELWFPSSQEPIWPRVFPGL